MYRNQPGLYVLYMVSALARKRDEQRERGVGSGSIVSRTVTLSPERLYCLQNGYTVSRTVSMFPKPLQYFRNGYCLQNGTVLPETPTYVSYPTTSMAVCVN
jgi:hypothetical protein